jgi:hypothetical protein
MRRSMHIIAGAILAAYPLWVDLPAMAAGSHPSVIRPAASPTSRSFSSRLSARANARANNAAGSPYVNPNVAAGPQSVQADATAHANAAEMESAHQSIATP